jgi:hypothetical protein
MTLHSWDKTSFNNSAFLAKVSIYAAKMKGVNPPVARIDAKEPGGVT